MVMALLFSTPLPTLSSKPLILPPSLLHGRRGGISLLLRRSNDAGPGVVSSTAEEEEEEKKKPVKEAVGLESNRAAADVELSYKDPRWAGGTWDVKQFQKGGRIDWDDVIDAEARRRKWFEDNPESTNNDQPINFDTSIIPWWAWMKRFHLPEAELLNGRAAMIGFFMAYFVDSLTGLGLVDQMGNFFCKTLLFVAVAGVLLIRKNEDVENLKKLLEETTFYDKQWQATWQDDASNASKEES